MGGGAAIDYGAIDQRVADVLGFGDIAIDAAGLTVRIVDGLGQTRFSHTVGAE